MSYMDEWEGRSDTLKPETLEVPDNVRREIERLQYENARLSKLAAARHSQRARYQQRAERAEAERDELQSFIDGLGQLADSGYTAEREARERAEAERDEAQAKAWNEHNACGVCPYRKSLQESLGRAEAALREILALTEVPGSRLPDEVADIHREARAIVEGKDPSTQRLESDPSAVRSANSRPNEPEAA